MKLSYFQVSTWFKSLFWVAASTGLGHRTGYCLCCRLWDCWPLGYRQSQPWGVESLLQASKFPSCCWDLLGFWDLRCLQLCYSFCFFLFVFFKSVIFFWLGDIFSLVLFRASSTVASRPQWQCTHYRHPWGKGKSRGANIDSEKEKKQDGLNVWRVNGIVFEWLMIIYNVYVHIDLDIVVYDV